MIYRLAALILLLSADPAYALNAPAKLTATAVSATQIDLKWQDKSTNETGFRIWRQDADKLTAVIAVPADTTSYSDTSVAAGKTYSYKVEALIESGFSNTASATTPSGGGGGGGNSVFTPITGDPSYKLVFDDEFNGNSLDTSKWYPPVDQPDNSYPNDGKMQMLIANVSVHDGLLDLKATKGPTPNGSPYGTSALTTKGNTISGQPIEVYWEARMKNMDQAYGLMSGFWTDTAPNYNFPESDFNEYWQSESKNTTRQNYHDGNNWVYESRHDTGMNLGAAYHVYGTHWTPTTMTFYIDGKQTGQTTTNTNRSNPQFYAIVNASAGGGGIWPDNTTLFPNHVLFDYIHVYSAQAGAVAVAPDTNYGGPGDNRTSP
jgi:beta-glucanase (GH16 family)